MSEQAAEQAVMQQAAPYPTELAALVNELHYRPGWRFRLQDLDRGQDSVGLTLIVTTQVEDTYHPGEEMRVNHFMPVPPASFDHRSWQRWLLDQLLLIERHEACEFFRIGDERPYAPHHGPGNDPYIVFDHGTDLDVRTSFRGDVN